MELCKLCDTFVPDGETDTIQVHNGTVIDICHDCSYSIYQIVADVIDPV